MEQKGKRNGETKKVQQLAHIKDEVKPLAMLYKQLMNLNFIVVIYSSYLIARMSSAGFSPPSMNWEAPNVEKEFRHFKQYCELIFDGPFCNKSKKERISFILLIVGHGKTMIRKRNQKRSWEGSNNILPRKQGINYSNTDKNVMSPLPIISRDVETKRRNANSEM